MSQRSALARIGNGAIAGSKSPLTPTPLPPQSRGERVVNCVAVWNDIMRLVIALLVSLSPSLLVCEARAELKAGTALVDVTPEKLPVIVNGMFNSRTATGALDKL